MYRGGSENPQSPNFHPNLEKKSLFLTIKQKKSLFLTIKQKKSLSLKPSFLKQTPVPKINQFESLILILKK